MSTQSFRSYSTPVLEEMRHAWVAGPGPVYWACATTAEDLNGFFGRCEPLRPLPMANTFNFYFILFRYYGYFETIEELKANPSKLRAPAQISATFHIFRPKAYETL
jgi:hypothetical protein